VALRRQRARATSGHRLPAALRTPTADATATAA
jgi:hypothetical protein